MASKLRTRVPSICPTESRRRTISALIYAILMIFLWRANKQMIWIAAWRVIAAMTYVVIIIDLTAKRQAYKPMNSDIFSRSPNLN